MITVSSTIRNLLKTKHRQVVRITVGNTGLTLTGEHIAQDGLSIDRYCASGSTLELGSAISAELTLKLLNFDGSFDNVTFEGQELKVEQGVVDSGNTYWFDMGYFKVDTPPRKKSTISITALDRMVKFDESAYAWSATQTYPMTVAQMVSAVCQRCYVTLATNLSNLPNANVSIPKDPVTSEEITFRNIIQWASAIMGTCAYINESGQLVFGWISNTDINITPEYRYQGADLWEGNVTITGYTFSTTIETETEDDVTTEDVTYYSGTLEYPIDLSANPLVASAPQAILDALYSAIGTITYRPFECTTIPFPYIMPLDRITYTDPNGNEISTLVTNVVHNLNLGSAIAGKGDTETTKGYSTGTGFTPSQTKELTKTQILIEQASAAATSAQASADSAHASAVSANNSANSALTQLSVVEDVAGTLNWIREHGSFVQTTDTTVHETTVYFELINGEYVPIAQPDPTKNPSEEGWYILDVTDSQSEYIMAHLAVTSAGLWVLPFTPLVPHPLVDSADNDLVDSDNNQLVDWSRDPQNANGYKALFASDGMTIYDNMGTSVAHYGTTTTIGAESGKHVFIDIDSVDIKDGENTLSSFDGTGMVIYDDDGELASFSRLESTNYSYAVLKLKVSNYDSKTRFSAGGLKIDLYGDDSISQQYAFPPAGIYKTELSYQGLFNNNNPTPVGTVYEGTVTEDGLSRTCESSKWMIADFITLRPGTWLITFGGAFSSNATGMRYWVLNNSNSSSVSAGRYDMGFAPANGGPTIAHASRIVKVANDTTFYLHGYQTSSSDLTVSPVLKAVQLV